MLSQSREGTLLAFGLFGPHQPEKSANGVIFFREGLSKPGSKPAPHQQPRTRHERPRRCFPKLFSCLQNPEPKPTAAAASRYRYPRFTLVTSQPEGHTPAARSPARAMTPTACANSPATSMPPRSAKQCRG